MSETSKLTERLDRILPQTQCGQCGYDGCRPYAEAMACGQAGAERCPPGGDAGARALAHVLGIAAPRYDRSRGQHKPAQLAWIVEADCIGCTKCIQACPVDAIVGGAKYMHTVLAPLCTGCELCVPACPVDCIELHPASASDPSWSKPHAALTQPLAAASQTVAARALPDPVRR